MKWETFHLEGGRAAYMSRLGRFVVSVPFATRSGATRVHLTDTGLDGGLTRESARDAKVYLCLDQQSAKRLATAVALGKGPLE